MKHSVFLETYRAGFGAAFDEPIVGADHHAGPLLQILILVSIPWA